MSAIPGLSIVIPTRDTCELTLRCLAALRQSRCAPDEIILVDDGGRDGTFDRVRVAFPDVRLVRHDSPAGFSAAANAGLRMASGSLLLLLNSDTEVRRDSLQALAGAFAADATLGIAGAQLLDADGSAQWSGGAAPDTTWMFVTASGILRPLSSIPGYRRLRPLARRGDRDAAWVTGAALAMRRAVWAEQGPIDERFRLYAQDVDLCTRARAAGWRVRVVRDFTVAHHQGATVARVADTVDGYHLAALWTDLVLWAAKTHGPTAARRARHALTVGGLTRLLVRSGRAPFVSRRARPAWDAQQRCLREALAALVRQGDQTPQPR